MGASRGPEDRKVARVMCSALETGFLWLQGRQGRVEPGAHGKLSGHVCGLHRTVADWRIQVPVLPQAGYETPCTLLSLSVPQLYHLESKLITILR